MQAHGRAEVVGQRKLLQWTVPGTAHALTFWGFIVLLLTIIEAYGALFSRTFAIPVIGHWAFIGFIEDLFAVNVAEVHQEISAALVASEQVDGFRVKPGSPVLEVRRTYKMTDGTIGQITINTHPASRFRHSMTMRRVKA